MSETDSTTFRGDAVIDHVREHMHDKSIPATDIIRHSTRVKRQFPGLTLSGHVKRVCSEMDPHASEAALSPSVAELRVMFPHVDASYLQRALDSHGLSVDAAASALIYDGCLRRKPSPDADASSYQTASVQKWYVHYLANMFPWTSMQTVRASLTTASGDLMAAYTLLSATPCRELSTRRALLHLPSDDPDVDVCFAKAREVSDAHMKAKRRRLAIDTAIKSKNMRVCSVCYETFPYPEVLECASSEHAICEPCAVQYVSTELFDSGRATTKCVLCAESYHALRVRELLPKRARTVYDIMESKAALAAAGIADSTHTCKCGNCVLLSDGSTVHRCIECGHSTCVLCNEDDHLPLRCDQVESRADASVRHKIEEAMTAALVRKCVCGQTFLKESGCNKMTCRCGRKMCYLCRELIDSYDHFYNDSPCKLFAEADDDARVEEAGRVARAQVAPSAACSST